MKKDGFKRNSKIPKPRMKPREGLSELNFNILDSRNPVRSKQRVLQPFDLLPQPLHIHILGFLSAKDLLHSVQLLSQEWLSLCSEPIVWQWLEQSGLSLKWRVKHSKCLVERRSKGKIFRGVLRSSLTPVTVRKVMLQVTNAGYDDGVPTSLLREITYLSELSHPNIVPFLGVELAGKNLSIMHEQSDYNLKEYMRKFGQCDTYRMPVQTIRSLVKQLLQALSYLHDRRFMHRNLKPDNLLVSKQGELRVTDFAMSKLTSVPHIQYTPEDPKERDRSGREARRLWYRAPELLLRKEMYSFEVDLWTVGCILAELALGQPLFNGENEIEQLFKVFRFTGVPDGMPRTFPRWEPINFCDVFADKNSVVFKRMVDLLVPARDCAFKSLVKLGQTLGPEGLELLQRLLEVDPLKRISVKEALAHPFIDAEKIETLSGLDQFYDWEKTSICTDDYMKNQPSLNETMRSILVDWLIDVSVHFEVTDDTLHLAVGLIDRALEKIDVDRSKLQLVGVTCMKIADVLNEKSKEYYRQENSIEYAYITADEYTPAEVVHMEKVILNSLNFKVITPTVLSFLKPQSLELGVDQETHRLALYLSDLILLSYDSIKYRPSLLASAVLYLACCSLNRFPDLSSGKVRPRYTEEEFRAAVKHAKEVWGDARSGVYSRYESINHKFHAISPFNIWPPAECSHGWIQQSKFLYWH